MREKLLKEDLSSLNRKVWHETGLNIGTLLNEERQKKSYEGLKKKSFISKIAWECGFSDQIIMPDGSESRWVNPLGNGGLKFITSRNKRQSKK